MSDRTSQANEITISRAKLESITVYDVMEEELDIIERGSPNSTYLNFSIALISIAISFSISLLTTKIDNSQIFTTFIVVTLVSYIVGLILFVIWLRTNKQSRVIFIKIRSRKATSEIRQNLENYSDNETQANTNLTK